jgi:hypothetical protein
LPHRTHNSVQRRGLPSEFARRRAAPLPFATVTLALAVALLASGCRLAARSFGTGSNAATHAEQLFGAVANRYTNVTRGAKYTYARDRLAQTALIPSKAFGDTAIWTGGDAGDLRTLFVRGTLIENKYRLDAVPSVPPPSALGDARHVILLTRLGKNEYAWDTNVDFGVGSIKGEEAAAVITALWTASEGRSERDLRADYRATFPLTAASLGRLFSIDSLTPVPQSDGSTATTVLLRMHTREIDARFPLFAKWLAKYGGGSRFRFRLADAAGTPWLDVAGANGRTRVSFRSQRGHPIPLTGPPKPVPESFQLTTDWTMKVKIFSVGVRNLVSEFRLTTTPHERGFSVISKRAPDWSLPLITEHLISSSLKYPFQGNGALFSLSIRDSVGAPSRLLRHAHLGVQESGMMRFLSGLSSHAVNEFDAGAEREQEVFLREVFMALAQDVGSLSHD